MINKKMSEYIRLGVRDKFLYDIIMPETEIEMDKILRDIVDNISADDIMSFIKSRYDVIKQ